MRKLVAVLLLSIGFSFSQVFIVVSRGLERKDIKELFFSTGDVVVIVSKNLKLLDRVFRKLLGISYEDYKLYRYELALDGRGMPPIEVPGELLSEEAGKHERVIVITPHRLQLKDMVVLEEVK